MDPRLTRQIKKQMPEMNDRVCSGIANEHIKWATEFIDAQWRNALAPLEAMGLTYHGGVRCPLNECLENSSSRSSKGKRYLELEKTDMFLMKYFLKLHGEELPPVYLYVPYTRPGGLTTIKGSVFTLSPVLIDRAISVGEDQIFVNVAKDRFSFRRTMHYILQDNERLAEYVVWANIHHVKRSARGRGTGPYSHVQMDATPVLYLLCKLGLKGTMEKYGTKNYAVGTEFPEDKYPRNEWSIFSSTQTCPPSFKGNIRVRSAYIPTNIKVAVKTKDVNPRIISLLTGLFYIIDHFPDRCEVEYMDDLDHWRLILGHNTFNTNTIESRLLQDIDSHINSLDNYIDGMVKKDLHKGGVPVEDLYDLFVYMLDHLPLLISQGAGNINTLYGKQLVVLPYVLRSVIEMIFTFSFLLRPGSQRELVYKDVVKIMRSLKPTIARKMNSGNAAVSSTSSSCDNMLFRITTTMIQQNNSATVGRRSRKISHNDASALLNASLAEAASWNQLPKSSPTGYERINPYVLIDEDSVIQRNPKFIEIIDKTQALIQK